MSRKKRKYTKRSRVKLKLKNDTIYTLFAITLIFLGIALFFSYTQNGAALTKANEYLVGYFGVFSFLIPINFILIGLLMSKIKSKITSPNVVFGFLVFSISVLGLFQSGALGLRLFSTLEELLGGGLSLVIFFVGLLVGLIVFLNVSLGQIIGVFQSILTFLGVAFSKILPLFKTRRDGVSDMKQITIKGLEKPVVAEELGKEAIKQPERKNGMPDQIVLNKPLEIGVWEYPPLSLLSLHAGKRDTGDVKKIAGTIEKTLQSFGIQARVSEINVGPSVTQYAIEIALGTKLSKITGLANDLALATEAPTGQIRIEAPIPGRNLVGIEIPNKSLEIVSLKTMLESPAMQKVKSKLAVPLGLDVSGNPVIADLARMPHVLIAGTTGSGKSVLVNGIISSLLFRASPAEVKMILIDPKRVELTGYADIPHLMTPVVVEAAKAVSALKWAMKEMDRRYVQFADSGVRNIDAFNELSGFQALPYIVIFIDELADLMALAAVEVEDSITRLAQMARATGIHLVLATQRPSVDVITGLIKANIPSRISFSVSSMIDSKVIIDMPGAEKLLGRGDMLFIPPDQAKPARIQGAFISDQDVKRLVNFIKARGIPVEYTTEVLEQQVNLKRGGTQSMGEIDGGEQDDLFAQAVTLVCQYDRASSSFLQRRLRIGFNRAARLLEQLEEVGVVGPGDGSKPREVLIKNPETILNKE
jgi:S-DNA-T family DNA segregation ATPase FtsK/SpoIIIE